MPHHGHHHHHHYRRERPSPREMERMQERRREREERAEEFREEQYTHHHHHRHHRRHHHRRYHHHYRYHHHHGDDHPHHQREHGADRFGDSPFGHQHGHHHHHHRHHRREHGADRYAEEPTGRYGDDGAFGLGHDPGDRHQFRGERHGHRGHRTHYEPEWAEGRAYGFDERHGHGGFDPRAHERGFGGGHRRQNFGDDFERADPFSDRRHHHGHGHGHAGDGYTGHHDHDDRFHGRRDFDRDAPPFFDNDDDLDDDDIAFSDGEGFGPSHSPRPGQDGFRGHGGFEGHRHRGYRHHHRGGEERFGYGGFDDHYPSSPPYDGFDIESDDEYPQSAGPEQPGDGRTHYEVLGVSQSVDQATLDKAAKLARVKAHPDKNIRADMSADEKQRINDEAARIGQAADILMNRRKRAQYDMELRMGQQWGR